MIIYVDQPIRSTDLLDRLKRSADSHGINAHTEDHYYTSGQSWRNPSRDAVYLHADGIHQNTVAFIAEFPNAADAGFAATALNRARPFEYSLIDALTQNAPQPQDPALELAAA